MPAFPRLAGLALATILAGACSRDDAPAPKAQPAAPKTAEAPATSTRPAGEIDEKLKERLARQEAAAKMFESNVLNPPAPRVPEPPKALVAAKPAAPTPDPAPATPVPASPAPAAAAPQPAPATTSPPPAPVRVDPPKPAAPPASASPAPRTDVAAARPSSAPESTSSRLVTRVDPDFPREAVVAGVDSGLVKARMTLDAGGNVTRVEILDANPRRVFDRAVIRALSQWRYSDGVAGRTVDMEVAFRR